MSLDLQPGSLIGGRYEVIDTIGRGGYAVVLRGRQVSTGQQVAIKVLLAHELLAAQLGVQRARFEREMSLIARLQHPNIVRLIDSGVLPTGDLFSVLEHVQGQDLATWLAGQGALPVAEVAHLMTQVLDALSCAHSHGIVHRDLKPANIMVTTGSARRNAMVLDFGIAALVEGARDASYETLTLAGTVIGSPSYMSPEQVRGEAPSVQSDLYSWGLVFIECLTGCKVMDGEGLHDIMARQVATAPVEIPPAIVDERLRSLLSRAVAKPLERRFKSAADAMRALGAWSPQESHVDLGRGLFNADATVPVNTSDPRLASLLADFKRGRSSADRASERALLLDPGLSAGPSGDEPSDDPPTEAFDLSEVPAEALLEPAASLEDALAALDAYDEIEELVDDGPTTVAMPGLDMRAAQPSRPPPMPPPRGGAASALPVPRADVASTLPMPGAGAANALPMPSAAALPMPPEPAAPEPAASEPEPDFTVATPWLAWVFVGLGLTALAAALLVVLL